MRKILILLIKGYRLGISPMLGKPCRFHPTCSEYGIEALEKHGAIKGTYLTVKRVLRCHPFAKGGIDYVPETVSETTNKVKSIKES